jgi:hypothetical protein
MSERIARRTGNRVVPTPVRDVEHSWLGRWADVGWAIRFPRVLTDEEWGVFGACADETWDTETHSYSSEKTIAVIRELSAGGAWPKELADAKIHWPKCTHRTATSVHGRRTPVYLVCDEEARYTRTNERDVLGNKVAIPRCAAHQGVL